MTGEEARQYWQFRLDNAKDYIDPHWEADERRAHREYVEALTAAIEALKKETGCDGCRQLQIHCFECARRKKDYYKGASDD